MTSSHTPTAARGSSGTPVTRLICVSSLTTWAALANAASTAPTAPTSESTHTLDGRSLHTAGAPAPGVAPVVVTAGNGSGSSLYQVVNSGAMPQGQAKLSAANIAKIKAWIDQGAMNN